MANQKIFCNTPWYEAHIYWDGSLGICCQESRKLYNLNRKSNVVEFDSAWGNSDNLYNIKTMTLKEWFNSEPVRKMRVDVLSDQGTDVCSWCYDEEKYNPTSRRHRSNQKSVIFTINAFQDSYDQSPGQPHFYLSETSNGMTDTLPIDIHVDLGNYCNLACKMCWSGASSKIASQYVKWGHEDHQQYLGNDWTKDTDTWLRFLNELLTIPKLKNIHFMGGETLLTPRFEEFVDFMILHQRFDLSMSFVTNGTKFNESLINKLKQFTRVGIEVSIESITSHNDYIRQGTNTKLVLENIKKYQSVCIDSKISVTIRSTINILSIGYYYTLLEYCLENKLAIKSLLVTVPSYLDSKILPDNIKSIYKEKYLDILKKLETSDINSEFNESDPNNFTKSIKLQTIQVINLLSVESSDNESSLKLMVEHCQKWDQIYKFNALDFYPEFLDIFKQHGY
jgi:molybdenum cofactor biosynthesis enzyme MoaA